MFHFLTLHKGNQAAILVSAFFHSNIEFKGQFKNMVFLFSGPFLLYAFWKYMCNCLTFSPATKLLFSHHSLCCLPVDVLRTLKGDIAASCAMSKPQVFSHYSMESFHSILDFRKLNVLLYRINYHLLTINAIILSLLQHDLFCKIHSWVILSREISFLFLLGSGSSSI